MAEPASTLGDGDEDGGDDQVIECAEPTSIYNPTDDDEIRRAYIVETAVNPDNILAPGLVDKLDDLHNWLRDGTVKRDRKPDNKLKVVKE